MSYWGQQVDFSTLVGKVITRIQNNDDELIFHCDNGDRYKMYHSQDCCESVSIDDICGDLQDIMNTPVLYAEEARDSNSGARNSTEQWSDDSYTWTFYKIDTVKGGVTIRWYGSSNGYYSESVDFVKLKENDD